MWYCSAWSWYCGGGEGGHVAGVRWSNMYVSGRGGGHPLLEPRQVVLAWLGLGLGLGLGLELGFRLG